jgi:tRNA-splicing ligase RtcB
MKAGYQGPLERVDECRWRIPKSAFPGMRVDGLIYADDTLIKQIRQDNAPVQVANVAHLPGIQRASLAMPDIHWGYGFCIGGVAATDPEEGGVVSPGGVGYDINCGVRLVHTNLIADDVQPRIKDLIVDLFNTVPCGVGVGGAIRFSEKQERRIMTEGSRYVVQEGYGWPGDLEATEAGGGLDGADPEAVGDRAYERGKGQVGTLGSGNHFCEVQVVDEVFDAEAAAVFDLQVGRITVMIHSGSRGLGYQVCDDYLRHLAKAPQKFGIQLPDRQLVCAPVHSKEGQQYLSAMRGAANYAWANRQVLLHLVRDVFGRFFGRSAEDLGMSLIYDVAHNIAKMEEYELDGRRRLLCVHRKGATRAFPPGHPEVPARYRAIGQPVLIPGDMGRASYLLVGQPKSMTESFGSTCHGAGRVMSRSEAIRQAKGRSIGRELAAQGIVALGRGRHALDEEQPAAYKDVNEVVEVVHRAGLSRKVCRLRPLGVIKG